jgi:phage terminase small subunit
MLKNVFHEKFCQAYVSGKTVADSYRIAYPNFKGSQRRRQTTGYKLKKRNDVATRITELQNQLEKRTLWTRETSVKELAKIALKGERDSDKISSIKELNAMHGFNAPIEQNVNFKGQHNITKTYVKMDELNAD